MRFVTQYLKSASSVPAILPPQKPIVELIPFLRAGLILSCLSAITLLVLGLFYMPSQLLSAFHLGYFGYSIFVTLILGVAFGFWYSITIAKEGGADQALEFSITLIYLPFFAAVLLGVLAFNDTRLYFTVVVFVFSSLFLNLRCLNQQTVYLLLLFSSSYILDLFATSGADRPIPSAFDLVSLSCAVILLNMVLQKIIKHFRAHAQDLIEQKQKTLEYQNKLEATVDTRTLELIKEKNVAIQESMAKSQFLANMSHELRTPLNAIIGYSELIQEEIDSSGSTEMRFVSADVGRIYSAGRNLLQLVNNVLDFSKIEANQTTIRITKIDIGEIIYDAVSLINPLLGKTRNELHIAPVREDLIAYGDPQKLKQVLINLLSNANKFTQDGTIIVSVDEDESHLKISVADTGIGIKPEQLDKLFKPFSQIENTFSGQFEGTGLGLAISKRFMELMNGSIDVQSVYMQGSIFTIRVAKISPRKQLEEISPNVASIR